MDLLVEVSGVAGRHRLEIVRALLLLEPEPRRVVRGEDPSRRAELGDHVGDRAPLGVAQRGHAGPRELEETATAAAHALFLQQLEDDVLGLNPRALQLAIEEDADELRARQLERVAGHADGDVEAAGAHRDHRARARLGRVAVGSDEGLARLREPLAVDVVADSVSRAREPGAVLRRHGLEESVVVRVLEIDLQDVVVDVDDRGIDLHAVLAEHLELHHRHRPRRVLHERLVDRDADLLARDELTPDEVLFEDRARERSH